jgi:hypothetical protein
MKKSIILFLLFISNFVFAQENFSNCAAILIDNQMLVEEYSNTAKCKLSIVSKGLLSAGTVNLGDVSKGEKQFEITGKISFSIAIKDANTGTIIMFSNKKYKKIDMQKVLLKCKKGDSIIIMTNNTKYVLPHNDIFIY